MRRRRLLQGLALRYLMKRAPWINSHYQNNLIPTHLFSKLFVVLKPDPNRYMDDFIERFEYVRNETLKYSQLTQPICITQRHKDKLVWQRNGNMSLSEKKGAPPPKKQSLSKKLENTITTIEISRELPVNKCLEMEQILLVLDPISIVQMRAILLKCYLRLSQPLFPSYESVELESSSLLRDAIHKKLVGCLEVSINNPAMASKLAKTLKDMETWPMVFRAKARFVKGETDVARTEFEKVYLDRKASKEVRLEAVRGLCKTVNEDDTCLENFLLRIPESETELKKIVNRAIELQTKRRQND